MAKTDLVNQLTNESWDVHSLNSERSYEVKVADSVHAYDLWCTCSAWRFKKGEKDCKHCEAVRQIDKGNNVPTKQTITKPSKNSKLKTTNPFLKLAGQLNEVAESWDRLDETVCCDILDELNYDPEVAYQKQFRNLGDKVQKLIAKDYLAKNPTSKTIKEIVVLTEDPRNNILTGQWWDNLDEQIKEDIAQAICKNKNMTWVDDEYERWDRLENDIKSELHEHRLKQIGISLTSKTTKSKRSVKVISKKNIKVTCWHCDYADQKILDYDEAFDCDKCGELLWVGVDGFVEVKVGVYR